MLADAVEGATRRLKERTPGRISDTVHEMTLKRLLDGQLDQSGLMLSDLHRVEEALTKALLSVYHGRVPYPPASRDAVETNGSGGKGELGARAGTDDAGAHRPTPDDGEPAGLSHARAPGRP